MRHTRLSFTHSAINLGQYDNLVLLGENENQTAAISGKAIELVELKVPASLTLRPFLFACLVLLVDLFRPLAGWERRGLNGATNGIQTRLRLS